MKNDNLIFFQIISLIKIKSSNDATIFKSTIVDLNVFKFSKKYKFCLDVDRIWTNNLSLFIM